MTNERLIEEKLAGPVLRYFGGKWRIAPWIVSNFPDHRHYTEVFGGAANVLLRKPRSESEVYNDLSNYVVDLFRVLRDPQKKYELIAGLEATPFSRQEFFDAEILETDSQVEKVRKYLVISHMRHGSGAEDSPVGEGFRSSSKQTFPAVTFKKLPTIVGQTAERFRGVLIEKLPAVEVLRKHDTENSLHYVDPPYHHATRSSSHGYLYEMDEAGHIELCEVLKSLKGRVVLSGYANPIYDTSLKDWRRVERKTTVEKGLFRTEVLWIK